MRARVCCLASLIPALLILAGNATAQEMCVPGCFPEGPPDDFICVCPPAGVDCVPPGKVFLCEGDVIATDANQGRIVRVKRPFDGRNDLGTLALPGGIPEGISVDSRGFIYWTDAQSNEVLRFNPETSTGTSADLIAPDLLSQNPFSLIEDLEISPDGTQLVVVDAFNIPAIIWTIDPISGVLSIEVVEEDLNTPRPSVPEGIAFDPHDPNLLYITDGSATRGGVYRVDLADGLKEPEPLTDTDEFIPGTVNPNPAFRALLDAPGGGGTATALRIQAPYDVEVYDPTPGDNTIPDHVLLVSNQPFPNCCGFDPPSPAKVFVITNPSGALGTQEAYQLIDAPELIHPLGIALADENPALAPDGQPDHVYVADLDGDAIKRYPIRVDVGEVVVDPATDSFAGFTAPWGIHVVGEIVPEERSPFVVLNRGRLFRTTIHPAEDLSPAWSPDGSQIAFRTDRNGGAAGNGDAEIWVMDADGANPVQLTDNTVDDDAPDWSPTASRIAFRSDRYGDDEVFVMDGDGTDPFRLTNVSASDGAPAWSPDGIEIAFESNRDGDEEIYVSDAVGTHLIRLTPDLQDENDLDGDGQKTSNLTTVDRTAIVLDADLTEPAGLCVDKAADESLFYVATDPASTPFPDLIEIVEGALPDTGTTLKFDVPLGTGNNPGLLDPTRILLDADGNYLVIERDEAAHKGKIVLIPRDYPNSPVENFITSDYLDSNGDKLLYEPAAMAFDADGILVVANVSSDPEISPLLVPPLLRILPDLDTDLVDGNRVFPLPLEDVTFVDPRDMVIDRNADALVLDRENSLFGIPGGPGIVRVSSATGRFRIKSYTSSEFDQLNGIALDANREILVTEGRDPANPVLFPSRVFRVDPVGGTVFELFDHGDSEGVAVDTPFDDADGIRIELDTLDPLDDGRPPDPRTTDTDFDGFGASTDNCEPTDPDRGICVHIDPDIPVDAPACYNPDQSDVNENGLGDACELHDADHDGWREIADCDPVLRDCGPNEDNCSPLDPTHDCVGLACANNDQSDVNQDGFGDVCQPFDDDDDGIPEDDDADPDNPPLLPVCTDGQVVGCSDNCPDDANPGQENFNDTEDEIGDACDDFDGDGKDDFEDNCPGDSNPLQEDLDGDGLGDVCDDDDDGDLIPEDDDPSLDNCSPNAGDLTVVDCVGLACANDNQADRNDDGVGDACQPNDMDDDGIPETVENDTGPCLPDLSTGLITSTCIDNCSPLDPTAVCPEEGCANTSQVNFVHPASPLGDACDDSADGDGVPDLFDNCPEDANTDQKDSNFDGIGDVCQPDDDDDDGIPETAVDPLIEPCTGPPLDPTRPFCLDNCPTTMNSDQKDSNWDGIGDVCQPLDDDDDGIPETGDPGLLRCTGAALDAASPLCLDNCPADPNSDQTDSDGDFFGNRCDMDLNGDDFVGIPDFTEFGAAFGTSEGAPGWNAEADGNGDKVVGISDFSIFAQRFGLCQGATSPGVPPEGCPAVAP